MSEQHHHGHGFHETDNIRLAFFLNAGFTIVEFIGGWLTNSTAIMADAVHDLGDSLSIGLAWALKNVAAKSPDHQFSYGYRRFSLLGALVNAIVLVAGSIFVLAEAIPRLMHPEMPIAGGMLILAVVGVGVNGLAAWKVAKGNSLNERVINWHLMEDVLGWLAVLVVSIILLFFDLPILDPLLSISFTLFILYNVFRLLKETVGVFLQSVPDHKALHDIRQGLLQLDHVGNVHHMHFWSLDGEHHVLTAHIDLTERLDAVEQIALKKIIHEMLAGYNLTHTTIEFELPDEACRDA